MWFFSLVRDSELTFIIVHAMRNNKMMSCKLVEVLTHAENKYSRLLKTQKRLEKINGILTEKI